jgi:8-oxo-dGTP diphosphatase
MAMLQVVAAVIQRGGRILVCRRKAEQSHPLQWEFPGGKVEPGENPEQALARELGEELGITGATGIEMTRYQFAYPGKPAIELIFYRVQSFAGEPENLVFHEMQWELPSRLPELDFVEGDLAFIRGLASPANAVRMENY